MKKLYNISLLLIVCLAFFTSCDNELLEGEFAGSTTGSIENCEDAATIFQESTTAYVNASEDNFELACNNYKDTIQNILDSCQSELDDEFTSMLEGVLEQLGDCTIDVSACNTAQTASSMAATEYNNASEEEQEALCANYATTLQAEIATCGDPSGDIQLLLNELPCTDCGQAQINAENAEIAFNESDPQSEAEYEAICGLYSVALQEQITACGDPDGTLTATILELGDCTPPEEDGPVRLLLAGVMKNFNTANVTISGSLLTIVATDFDTGDTFTFDIVLQQTGTNVMQDVELTVNNVVHVPFMSGDTPFTSEITENTGTTLVGTFTGTVTTPDGDFVATSNGVIDIEY